MISIQEMTAWTSRDIEAAIHVALPRGWRFSLESEQGVVVTTYTDEEGRVVWMREGIDARLGLFDAFGWLQRRQQPLVSGVWKPRSGEVRRPRLGSASLPGVPIADPLDLDPAEIDAVYREHLNRRQ